MKFVIVRDYQEMSCTAAEEIAKTVSEKPTAVLGLPTGRTPIGMYQSLVQMYKVGEVDFSQVKSFNLDEYVGLSSNHPQSYHVYMHNYFFSHINVLPEHINIPCGHVQDLPTECDRYEESIRSAGGIDLQVLGIGGNGHIGFNEPGSSPTGKTGLVHLAESTIQTNSRNFESVEDVPRQAITMGMGTIHTNSKRILLLANGEEKAQAIKNMVEQDPNAENPASFLKLHKDVTVIVDEKAAKYIVNHHSGKVYQD
jgi:glucosamine-6-phosphate deaminase